jgi:hypothetical protein
VGCGAGVDEGGATGKCEADMVACIGSALSVRVRRARRRCLWQAVGPYEAVARQAVLPPGRYG